MAKVEFDIGIDSVRGILMGDDPYYIRRYPGKNGAGGTAPPSGDREATCRVGATAFLIRATAFSVKIFTFPCHICKNLHTPLAYLVFFSYLCGDL